MSASQEKMSMTDTLTAPLTSVTTLSNTLFQSLSSPHPHARPSIPPPPISSFLNVEASLARALAETASHQRRQKRIEELIAEIGALDARWRWVVERIEEGKRELEAVVKEGEERIEGIRKAKDGEELFSMSRLSKYMICSGDTLPRATRICAIDQCVYVCPAKHARPERPAECDARCPGSVVLPAVPQRRKDEAGEAECREATWRARGEPQRQA